MRMLHSVKAWDLGQSGYRFKIDVPLDGAETKSEDCQRDAPGTGCSSADDGLKLLNQGGAASRQHVPEAFRGEP
jgi:hypothetical protein